MFGKNAIASRVPGAAGFRVHSMFPTIQGEGPYAGVPAIFVRLAGCNLRCWFCDTQFETPVTQMKHGELLYAMLESAERNNCRFFVFTGGEPMLQEIGALFRHEKLAKMLFQVETAGSVWPREDMRVDGRVSIVCSPKTHGVAAEIRHMASDSNPYLFFKYLISSTDKIDEETGIPIVDTQKGGKPLILYHPPQLKLAKRRIYLQPMDENDDAKNAANAKRAAELCMRYGYRLSLQLHKIVGLD